MPEADRNPNGTFVMTKATRQMISQKAIDRHRQSSAVAPSLTQGRKHCTVCKELKYYNTTDGKLSEFSLLRRSLKSGGVTVYPAGACKRCAADAAKARRAEKDDEERRAERRAYWTEYVANPKNLRRVRKYQREYQTILRRQQGATIRGPWKKYRRQARVHLNAEPLIRWLEPIHPNLLTDDHIKQLKRAEESGQLTVAAADSILTHLGCPHIMAALYGDLPTTATTDQNAPAGQGAPA